MTWFYLSFADPDRFRGGCYVQVTEEHRELDEFSALVHPRRTRELDGEGLLMWRAVQESHRLGINPGGEVLVLGPITDELMDENVPPADRERLLSREEAER